MASYHGSISAATARSAAMVDGLLKAAGEGSLEALAAFGAEMVSEIKALVGEPGKSDNMGPVNPRSLPWDPAALQMGDYQASWDYKAGTDNGKPYVDVGSTSPYACILSGRTKVCTDTGSTYIGTIRPGQKVLTQTGDMREVLAVSSFPALDKPDMVTIQVPWQPNRPHTLTTTTDHRILVHRAGRNKWIEAGDLLLDDEMFVRRKRNPNAGTRRKKQCQQCGRIHQKQGEMYCSVSCRATAWAELGTNPHLGAKRSDASRAKMRVASRKRFDLHPETHPNRLLAQRGYKTNIERQTEEWLQGRGVPFVSQFAIGQHFVDFWLPSERKAIEADGGYWHRDQSVDIDRDKDLIADCPDITIVHIHFHEPRFSPIIDPHPLPNVYYVVCNPGTESFVDPIAFVGRSPTLIHHWRYGRDSPPLAGVPTGRCRPKGGSRAMLYDLAVDGVHSFLASGLLVSNSYLEYGTRKMDPRPALRPATDHMQQVLSGRVVEQVTKAQREVASKFKDILSIMGGE